MIIIMSKILKKTPFKWTVIIAIVTLLATGITIAYANGIIGGSQIAEGNIDTNIDRDANNVDYVDDIDDIDNIDLSSFPQGPQVTVEVDLKEAERNQKQVDEGHSPWQLSPFAVTQTFVSLKISPEGIDGSFPIDLEDMVIIYETDEKVIVKVTSDKTTIKKVYLMRLIRQDETGIWSVVGYDSVSNESPPENGKEAKKLEANDDLQLGTLMVDMPREIIDKVLGKQPVKTESDSIPGLAGETLYYGDGTEILMYDGKIYSIKAVSPEYSTPRGLKTGDSVDRLQQLYGEPAYITEAGQWIYQSRGYDLFFVMVEDDVITEIKVSLVM